MPVASTQTDVKSGEALDGVGALGEDDQPPDETTVVVALVAILVVAAALRLRGLGDDSLWANEILSFRRATAPLSDAYELLRAGTHPPLFSQAVLRPWLSLGESEFMHRLPSAVFGVLTVAFTYLLGRRTFGWRVGLAAAALLAVLPLHVYYSREGRMYALLALLVTLWVGSLLRAHRSNSVGAWVIYTVLGAAILYTHYYAGLTVAVVVGTTGVAYMTTSVEAEQRRRWLISSAAIAVLFLPWMPSFVHQYRESSSTLPGRPIGELPALITRFFTGFVNVPYNVKALIFLAIAALSVLLVIAGRRATRTKDSDLFPLTVMAAAVVGTILFAVLISLVKPILFVRYFVGLLPMCCILLAAGAVTARTRVVGFAAYGVLFVVSVACVIPVLTDSWRPDFGDVGERIAADAPEDTVVLMVGPNENNIALSGFDHYNDADIPVRMIDSAEGSAAVADAVAGLETEPSRVWLLQYTTMQTFETPEGFDVAHEERYDSRFFERRFPMRLTLLESVP
ncbi:MAG: glycosyltransferase family 39 protein [Acidimicrobiia bacterium]|nr:glycosyltransferase family 39 protein [Acidimicrobiia bacterium]